MPGLGTMVILLTNKMTPRLHHNGLHSYCLEVFIYIKH